MQTHQAIILRSHARFAHRISLLSSMGNRSEAYFTYRSLAIGSVISYQATERNNRTYITHTQIDVMPFELARADILFLHHTLELCHFFVPVGSHAPEVYALLTQLYTLEKEKLTQQQKIIFLCKLMMTIGIEHHVSSLHPNTLLTLMAYIPDNGSTKALDLTCVQELQKWLLCCIADHPLANHFKTTHFLTGVHK